MTTLRRTAGHVIAVAACMGMLAVVGAGVAAAAAGSPPQPVKGAARRVDQGERAARKTSKTRRAAWGTLTRSQVIDAAIGAIEDEGLDNFSIRSLAEGLGVSPMSLYRHIENKDDLLTQVADQLLADNWKPRSVSRARWRPYLAAVHLRLYDLLVSEPVVLHVYLQRPLTTPAAQARLDSLLRVMRTAGCEDDASLKLLNTCHTYTIGFAALATRRTEWSLSGVTPTALEKRLVQLHTSREQYRLGLDLLLDGIEASLPSVA